MTALVLVMAAMAVGLGVSLTIGRRMLRVARSDSGAPANDAMFLSPVLLEAVLTDAGDRHVVMLTLRSSRGDRAAVVVRGDLWGYATRRLRVWHHRGTPITVRMLRDATTLDLQPPGRLPGLFLSYLGTTALPAPGTTGSSAAAT